MISVKKNPKAGLKDKMLDLKAIAYFLHYFKKQQGMIIQGKGVILHQEF